MILSVERKIAEIEKKWKKSIYPHDYENGKSEPYFNEVATAAINHIEQQHY